jgi:hypothetical protein
LASRAEIVQEFDISILHELRAEHVHHLVARVPHASSFIAAIFHLVAGITIRTSLNDVAGSWLPRYNTCRAND